MQDVNAVWMSVGRELYQSCERMNARKECTSGPLLCLITRYFFVVTVPGTDKMLRVAKEIARDPHPISFGISILIGGAGGKWTVNDAFSTRDGKYFYKSANAEQFTTVQLCEQALKLLCGGALEC